METIIAKIVGKVADNKLKVQHHARWEQIIKSFNGKDVVLTIEEWKDKRSLEQNAYYHVYLKQISEFNGDDTESLHAFFKKEFLPTRIGKAFGKEIELEKTTTKLSPKEFSEYLDRICERTGVPLPDAEGWLLEHGV